MRRRRTSSGVWFAIGVTLVAAHACRLVAAEPLRLDPAAWGGDHVGQPVPSFTTGDECLFCHREVGKTWNANRHNLTIRPADFDGPVLRELRQSAAAAQAEKVQLVLGDRRRQRFLARSKEYGHLDLLSVEWIPPHADEPGRLVSTARPHWDATRFADACAGCHTTAVDPQTKAFAALSLDCYTCHGAVPTEHPTKPELVYLSPRRRDEARLVISICAQCHIRGGTSRHTGRPYPTNFVAGDNLFRDFRVDWSDRASENLSSADRHILENVRDVAVLGRDEVTCLTCHTVHGRSANGHHRAAPSERCLTCHNADGPQRVRKPFSNFSKTCGY